MAKKTLSPNILFEDSHLMVLSKPAGLLSQGEIKGDPNLVDWARQYLGRHYVGLIHRLDRNTSGLMLVAKRTKAARRLTDALQAGQICRTYLGWVLGPMKSAVRWSHCLAKDERKNQVRVLAKSGERGKSAVLSAKPVASGRWKGQAITLVAFNLETGRSHQIRAQAAYEGFPILGDSKYGAPKNFPRPALHSAQISFPHPMTKEAMSFRDELPVDMKELKIKGARNS
ncbi:MAG: RluA family pseudouridine synthase [Candidatus Omnitrophota bacterium]|nr:RluA family pseudouridine synthase [Candidatus Omnitrophota bacterium]